MTFKGGVVGWPVEHSLSPALYHRWMDTLNKQGVYEKFPIRPGFLGPFLQQMRNIRGLSLTLPHKEEGARLCSSLAPCARRLQAVNTLVVGEHGQQEGHNTDYTGFLDLIRPLSLPSSKAVVLGAGGAARAVCAALYDSGFEALYLLNRTPQKASRLLTELKIPGTLLSTWEDIGPLCPALIVNATSMGLPDFPQVPLDMEALPSSTVIADLVYGPQAKLADEARSKGHTVLDGIDMLVAQARRSFALWFQCSAPEDPSVTDDLRLLTCTSSA